MVLLYYFPKSPWKPWNSSAILCSKAYANNHQNLGFLHHTAQVCFGLQSQEKVLRFVLIWVCCCVYRAIGTLPLSMQVVLPTTLTPAITQAVVWIMSPEVVPHQSLGSQSIVCDFCGFRVLDKASKSKTLGDKGSQILK